MGHYSKTEKVIFPVLDADCVEQVPVKLYTFEMDDITWERAYHCGYKPAHYPVPAVIVRTGFEPSGAGTMSGIPYIWLMYGHNRLTTFWKGLDPILEWFDTDGARHILRVVTMRR